MVSETWLLTIWIVGIFVSLIVWRFVFVQNGREKADNISTAIFICLLWPLAIGLVITFLALGIIVMIPMVIVAFVFRIKIDW